jgi:hypothetical protein
MSALIFVALTLYASGLPETATSEILPPGAVYQPSDSRDIHDPNLLSTLPDDAAPDPQRGRVIVFLDTECRLSRNHVYTLNMLRGQVRNKGIAFVGLFPHLAEDSPLIDSFRVETGAAFALTGDPGLVWAHRLGARVTPEVFLLDTHGNVMYSGALDDWAVSLGLKRRTATRHFLRDALIALVDGPGVGSPPAVRRVEPVGCLIE